MSVPAVPPTRVPTDVPGVEVVHFPEVWEERPDLPIDGSWSVTLAASDTAMQRVKFRTLHAAQHYLHRIRDLADWATFDPTPTVVGELGKAMHHAEAHAHEVDAVYPPGTVIDFANGPGIVDHSGALRAVLSNTPRIEWEACDTGVRCPVCDDGPDVRFAHHDEIGAARG